MPGSELAWDVRIGQSLGVFPALANRPGLGEVSALEADLRPFIRRGGKVLMYIGWNDTAIPPLDSVRYYRSLVATTGKKAADEGIRFFAIPDMGHCPANPTAATGYFFDPIPIVTAWRERRQKPNQIVVTHKTRTVADRSMTVCPYPQHAVYGGTGSRADAGNFACEDSPRWLTIGKTRLSR